MAVQWLRLWASTARDVGLTPGQEAKILHCHVMLPKKKKKETKTNSNICETAWVWFQLYHFLLDSVKVWLEKQNSCEWHGLEDWWRVCLWWAWDHHRSVGKKCWLWSGEGLGRTTWNLRLSLIAPTWMMWVVCRSTWHPLPWRGTHSWPRSWRSWRGRSDRSRRLCRTGCCSLDWKSELSEQLR